MSTAHAAEPEPSRDARRAASAAERANQILDAALSVFARRGYQRATTKEIAAEAGVAEGTIYNYFQSKRDLLIALLQRLITETLPAVFAQQGADARALLAAIIRDRMELFERLRPIAPVLVQELAVDEDLRREYLTRVIVPVIGQAAALMAQRMARGDLRPVNLRVAFPAIVGAVAMTTLANEVLRQVDLPFRDPPLEREQIIQTLVDFILYGVAGKRAIAEEV